MYTQYYSLFLFHFQIYMKLTRTHLKKKLRLTLSLIIKHSNCNLTISMHAFLYTQEKYQLLATYVLHKVQLKIYTIINCEYFNVMVPSINICLIFLFVILNSLDRYHFSLDCFPVTLVDIFLNSHLEM